MTRMIPHRLLSVTALTIALFWGTPLKAQLQFQEILRNTNQSDLRFVPNTVGAVISGGGDRLYVLKAQKDRYLKIIVNSTGARAFVAVFDSNGKELAVLTESSEAFEYKLPKTGNYYILGYSGPTIHLYDFTVRVD